MERKDTGKNILIAFLVIIIVLLVGFIAYNLGKENANVGNDGNDNVVEQGGDNVIKELSLNDTEVKKFSDKVLKLSNLGIDNIAKEIGESIL